MRSVAGQHGEHLVWMCPLFGPPVISPQGYESRSARKRVIRTKLLREAEFAFLRTEIYRGEIDLLVPRITAYNRCSERC
jgi:hypothetical protein